MPISINLTGVKTTPTPLPPGYYQAEVSACSQKYSPQGNAYISWVFIVTVPEEYAGRKAFFNTTLQPHALWSFKRVMIALGYDEEDLEGEIDFEPSDQLGSECTLVVVEDVWKGETVGKVDQILAAGEVDPDLI